MKHYHSYMSHEGDHMKFKKIIVQLSVKLPPPIMVGINTRMRRFTPSCPLIISSENANFKKIKLKT